MFGTAEREGGQVLMGRALFPFFCIRFASCMYDRDSQSPAKQEHFDHVNWNLKLRKNQEESKSKKVPFTFFFAYRTQTELRQKKIRRILRNTIGRKLQRTLEYRIISVYYSLLSIRSIPFSPTRSRKPKKTDEKKQEPDSPG